MNRLLSVLVVAFIGSFAQVATAAFIGNAFVIRNSNVGSQAPVVSGSNNSITAAVTLAGQKAGFGTPFFDGQPLSNVTGVAFTRADGGTSNPYQNIWIHNAAGTKAAIIAPVVGMTAGGGYSSFDSTNGLDVQTLGFNIYETDFSDLSWLGIPGAIRGAAALLHADNSPVLVSEIGSLIVGDPGAGNYSAFVGTGAPKNGTGFNLILGDSGDNYTSAIPYSLNNIVNTPEPGSLALLGGTLLMFGGRRRRR